MEYPLNQSAWSRGWNNTRSAWTSWQFYVWGAVGAVVIGGVFQWYWGLALIVFSMFCVWLRATVSAPIKQRNEARNLLRAKPKPIHLPNRGELIRAISEVQQTSGTLLMAQQQLDDLEVSAPGLIHTDELIFRDDAHAKYEQAMSKLQAEKMVAGNPFESILSDLISYISTQVWMKEAKPTIIGGKPEPLGFRTSLAIFGRIASRVGKVIQEIEELSGQARSRGDSQT